VNSYTLINLFSSYQFNPKISTALGIENILNADYYPTISQWAARAADYIKGTGARGTFTVSYKF